MQQEDEKRADDVYENIDVINDQSGNEITDTRRIQSSEHTGSVGVKTRSSRAAAVCLLLLCFLLLTAVIVLCVTFTQERQQLISKNENLTRERDQLKQKKNLQSGLDGWKYYQSSLYFISSELKNWNESRRYCTEKGADLIIINNREEHEFVSNISVQDSVWIGLTDSDEEGTWKWVDGSTLTSSFWNTGEPNRYMSLNEDCAVDVNLRNDYNGWNDHTCDGTFRWICEKTIF